MHLALFEVTGGGGGGLSPAVANIVQPFKTMSSEHVSVDAHKFPPKKRLFSMLAPRTSSRGTEKSCAQEFVKDGHDILNVPKELESGNSLPYKRPRLENSLKLDLDALTYYPAESGTDEDDVGDVSDDTSSDEDYQVSEVLKGERKSMGQTSDRVPRAHTKRRRSYVKSK